MQRYKDLSVHDYRDMKIHKIQDVWTHHGYRVLGLEDLWMQTSEDHGAMDVVTLGSEDLQMLGICRTMDVET